MLETFCCFNYLHATPSGMDSAFVFFLNTESNFLLQKSAHEKEKQHYRQLIEEVGWFFLSLLVLGYVEDIATGKSFHFPGDLSWAIYIEVS